MVRDSLSGGSALKMFVFTLEDKIVDVLWDLNILTAVLNVRRWSA